jgi:signal transduction histidine kinase
MTHSLESKIMTVTTPELVLIVDDNPNNLDVISEALSDEGFDVAIAISGERALQQLERKLPELILLDVMMPGIDGFEMCRRIKGKSHTSDIPIIFMTALSDTDSKVQALELGAVDYITKPFAEKEVLARVKTHLQIRRLSKQLEHQVTQKNTDLELSQHHLVQSEKMSTLGELVAGVAHEINNPIGCVRGNLSYAEDFTKDLLHLIDIYQHHYPVANTEIQQELENIDLDYLREDLPKIFAAMKAGMIRLTDISTSLRTFSRGDIDVPVAYNLEDGLDNSILILKHRLKANKERPAIEVITEYGNLPQIKCFPGQLNQVFMNILANAIDALDESNIGKSFQEIQANPNRITVKTSVIDNQVRITITDNGKGMSEEIQQKIFDNLFTTKGVGKGTGLGLAIAKSIVEETHGGKLSCTSILGQGTEFAIAIPVKTKG